MSIRANINEEQCDLDCSGTNKTQVERIQDLMLEYETVEQLSDLFKALGDPTRIKIIYALLQTELCVHDISDVLNMGQSAISHQLRNLRNARIVKRRKSGKTVYYSLDDEHIEEIFKQTLKHIKHD